MEYTSIEKLYEVYKAHPIIIKDTRQIVENCIFLAIKGENFDANEFADQAIELGAAFVIIDNPEKLKDKRYLLVEDTLTALQNLARHHRKQLSIPFIGITGSNGKTTTKELIHATLSEKYKTYATKGNYNNHIGVPLTILEINDTHEIAIIEMGASAQKEIEFLCSMSDPDVGLITNIGKAHLEGFGGIEGVKRGKSELYRHLESKDGLIFINEDDEVLKSLIKTDNKLSYGTNLESYCSGSLEQTHPNIIGNWKCKQASGTIDSPLYGEYNFYNMLAAACIGNYFNMTSEQIDRGINSYHSSNNRSELIEYNSSKVYLDAYNANPSSMEYSVLNFSKNKNPNKFVVLGDMFEVGEDSFDEHKKLINYTADLNFTQRVFVGSNFFEHKTEEENVLFFKTTKEAIDWFKEEEIAGAEILIKGSRGMALEKLLQ